MHARDAAAQEHAHALDLSNKLAAERREAAKQSERLQTAQSQLSQCGRCWRRTPRCNTAPHVATQHPTLQHGTPRCDAAPAA
jgi:CHAD domain-containing protein